MSQRKGQTLGDVLARIRPWASTLRGRPYDPARDDRNPQMPLPPAAAPKPPPPHQDREPGEDA